MAAYVVFAVTKVIDLEQLEAYRREAVALVERTPEVRFFAGPLTESLEGPPIALTVVAELADLDAAKRWYYSEDYQKLARIRMGATEGFGFIVESWGGGSRPDSPRAACTALSQSSAADLIVPVATGGRWTALRFSGRRGFHRRACSQMTDGFAASMCEGSQD